MRTSRKKSIALGLLILLILSFIAALIYNLPKEAEAAWWDDTFGYRHRVSFTHNADLSTSQAVTFTLDTAELIAASLMQADCDDTRFTTINGEPLSYDLTGTCDNATTTYEVIFPTIVNGSNVFFVYYGSPSAANNEIDSTGITALTPSGGDPSLTNPTSSGNQEKTTGPVAYWSFDEGYGTSTQDNTSNTIDGTITGATWQTEDMCVSEKCLYFDGTSDSIDMGTNSILNLNSNFTISTWIKVPSSAVATGMGVIAWGEDTTGERRSLIIWNGGSGSNKVYFSGYGAAGNLGGASTISDDKWHFVTVSLTSSNIASVYVDGKLENSGSVTLNAYSFGNVYVGATLLSGDAQNEYFKGFVDELKIYNYVRSAAQIKADYNAKNSAFEGSSVVLGANTKNLKSLSEGLIGYWKMDEASTPSVDYSGNGRNATWLDNTSSATGKYSNAVSFDGTNDGMSVSMTGIDTFSYAAWVKADIAGSTQEQFIITTDVGGNNNCRFLQFRNQNDNWYFGGQTGGSITTSTSSVTAGRWYYIVGTNDQTTNISSLYVDGTLVGTSTASTCTQSDNATYRFGRSSYQPHDNDFAGDLDEVRIYNRALSAQEVSQLYNFAPGPNAYYSFDEGAGATTIDKSEGKIGTFQNGASWAPGKYGKAVKLNVESNANQYVTVSANVSHDHAFTKEAWIRPTSISGCGETRCSIISNYFEIASNRLEYYDGQLSPTGWHTGGTITLNQWQHAAVSYDGTSVKLYLNGIQVANVAASDTGAHASGIIGAYSSNIRNFKGYIDEVRIFDYARTPKQIVEDMNGGHPSVGSPVGSALNHWKMDDLNGDYALDSRGNSNIWLAGADACPGDTECPTWTASGKFNGGLSFDGGDYMEAEAIAGFDNGGTANWSQSIWIKSDTNPTNNYGLMGARSSGFNQDRFLQITSAGLPRYYVYNGAEVYATGTTVVTDDEWHHLAGVFDGSYIYIYVDGRFEAKTATSTTQDHTGPFIRFSDQITDYYDRFVGTMDEAKTYSFALTADDVKADFNQGKTQVLGALGDNSNYAAGSANQIYCIPGDTTSCVAPVAEWKFEEGQGNTVNDTSGNSYTGTWSASGDHWASGKFGKGSKFNGDDIRIDVGNEFNTSSMTWSAWIKSDTFSSSNGFSRRILSQSSGTGATDNEIQLVVNTSSKAVWYGYDNAYLWNLTGNTTLAVDQWYHITGTIDGSSARLYVNGILDASTSYTGSIATTSNLDIGDHSSVTGASFDGVIDQIRIYNYSRTPAQIAWDYNQGAPVAHWKLDECQGSTANDSSGNGFAGTITPGDTSGDNDTVGSCGSGVTTEMWNDGTTGKYNGSLGFDGTNDYIGYGDPANLEGFASYSISGWIYPTSSSGTRTIIHKDLVYQIDIQSGVLNVANGTQWAYQTSQTIPNSVWTHFGMTWDGDILRVYLNGKLVNSFDITNGSVPANNNQLSIGRNTEGNSNFFQGQLDDVQIYNYALSQTQIKQIYNQGSAVRFGPAEGSP